MVRKGPYDSGAMELRGAVVLITGASSGFGELSAIRFARVGARVAVAARRDDRLRELAERIERAGGTALPVPCDVTDRSDIDSMRDRVLDVFGRCDVLVNNAGIAGTGRFDHQDAAFVERLIRTNLLGVVLTTKAFLPAMLDAGRGHVVNVASIAGRLAAPGLAVYGATKHAVVAFSEALYHELAPSGILVTTVNPGLSKTEGFPQHKTPRWLLVDADRVARVIVDVVRKGIAPEIFVPRWPSALQAFRVLTPPLYRWGVGVAVRRFRR
jgi:short-subunit dehydrogenase